MVKISQKINQPRICILGGGFAGLYTALYLSGLSEVKAGEWEVILVEKKDRFVFTPLLYEILTGELKRWQIAPSYQKLLSHKNLRFCQRKIEGVNLKKREIVLEAGESLSYDYLLLGVGTQSSFAPIPGLREYALTFRSLADTELLKEKLNLLTATERKNIRIAIIGGGANGVELAGKIGDKLKKRGEIHLIERGEKLLKHFDEGVRSPAIRALKKRRVTVHYQTSVKTIAADKITVETDDKTREMPIDLVLWAAGNKSREWVKKLDCQHNDSGKILIQPTLQLLDYPEVFALGDVAAISEGKKLPATAQVAYQQASCAAKNIKALLRGKPLKHFHYFHLGNMLTLGKNAAVVSSFSLQIEGVLAAIIRNLVYIQRLPTFRHRWQVLKHFWFTSILKLLRFFRFQLREMSSFWYSES